MKCLILAAGRGSRLRQRAESKPLLPVLGVPLIERTLRTALAAGVEECVVVTGHAGEAVRNRLAHLSRRLGVPVRTVHNPAWEHAENGRSVLAAEDLLDAPFLLMMADHLVEPALVTTLLASPPPPDGIALAVDGDLDNPLVDPDDVTRVRRREGAIEAIGKGLEPFDGYDTGVFLCTPALFDALREVEDTRLTAAVAHLARQGRVRAVDVTGRFWCDVDDAAALERAERALLARLRGKPTDGPVARWLNRPLSIRITRHLVRYPVTPNQISLFAFALSVLAAALFLAGGRGGLALGGVLAQAASIIDGCDGEVARLKYLQSDYGGWLDAVLDRYADALLLFGLTWYQWSTTPSHPGYVLATGFAAIIGSFMLSYTADKYDHRMQARILRGGRAGLRLGRDVRVLLVFLAALTGLVFPVLLLIALAMNAEVVRRLFLVRGED
ncbi:MAG: di-myo-inositol-1,3'-phosphate-1'-phosphate synthase [Gammaproteobacteria bacterium]|nr:MAG: di-myo-inositol-1,3'-phosphate-1'-phosphate synthase [Gammaproteobacteria bacterium]